ncbi:hypothetical protein EJB05_27254 [Eragrostis curvula]|uniref:Uncharacterized protein n=1 Tax=Eragrostis curvula TaxID=38414 RepID=A0A5J9UNN2_9POAL|nr:hypothetical protein EJB05_27254 [Eragrostis curvula]
MQQRLWRPRLLSVTRQPLAAGPLLQVATGDCSASPAGAELLESRGSPHGGDIYPLLQGRTQQQPAGLKRNKLIYFVPCLGALLFMIGSHLGRLKFQTLERGHMEEVIEDLAGNKVYKDSGIATFFCTKQGVSQVFQRDCLFCNHGISKKSTGLPNSWPFKALVLLGTFVL